MCCCIWKCWKCFWHISSKSSGWAICNVMDGGHRFGRWTLQWTRCFVLYCTGRWAALLMRLLFWVMATLVTSRAWQLATYVWGNVWQCIAMYGATGNWPPMYGAGSGEIRQFFNLLSEGIPVVNQNFWKKLIDGWCYGYNLDGGLLGAKVMVMMGVGTSPVRDGKCLRIST